MDDEPRRLGGRRVVEVHSQAGPVVRVGSGYAVGDDLVLTAGHVVREAILGHEGARIGIRLLNGDERDAELEWWNRAVGDAALLRVPAAPWRDEPDRGALRWGRLVGDGVRCRARGFPRAQAENGARDVGGFEGTVNASVASRSQRYDVDVTAPRVLHLGGGASVWQGMSGAGLLGPGRELLGVVLADPEMYAGSRLQALPVMRLFDDEEFRRLVGATVHDVEDVEDRGEVTALDSWGRGYLRAANEILPSTPPDFKLLQALYGAVPFIGRDTELEQLRAWCAAPNRFSVAVVTGDGGAGKTRLGAQLCRGMAEDGWSAGFADEKVLDRADRAGTRIELVWPTVLVIDYPDRMTDAVIELIHRLGEQEYGPRLRVLLLDRAPDGVTAESPLPVRATWWRKLDRGTVGLVEHSTRVSIRLDAGGLDLADRQRHAEAAWKRFSGGTTGMPTLDLGDIQYRNPLNVHLAVLESVRGKTDPRAGTLQPRFLRREQLRWADRLAAHHITDLSDQLTHQAVALTTLVTPTPADAVDLLTALPGLADTVGVSLPLRTRIANCLAELFPGGDRLAALAPDPLAEHLLAETPGLAEVVLAIHRHEACAAAHTARMLDALKLAADREVVREALRGLLVDRLDELVEAAARPDAQLADPLDTAIMRCKDFDHDGRLAAAAAKVGDRPPTTVDALARLHFRLAELAVAWHDSQQPTPAARRAKADALTDLVAYRAALREVAGAAADADRALAEYRSLSDGGPWEPLARAVYNSGTCLAQSGDPVRALDLLAEAAQHYGQLTGAGTDHVEACVDTLTNLAVCRADLGDQRGALEACVQAIEHYGRVSAGHFHFLVKLVEPLDILAKSLAVDPGDANTPPTAAGSYRPPSGTDPAWWQAVNELTLLSLVARVLPGVADRIPDTLRNGLVRLLPGRLAKQQARYAAHDYSELMRMLSSIMAQVGLSLEAIAPLKESVALLRRFAPDDDWRRVRLAEGLLALGHYCSMAGKTDDAIGYAAESIAAYRNLIEHGSDNLEPDLALVLAQLADYLSDGHRIPDAVEAWQEAVGLYAGLAERDPQYEPALASGCLALAGELAVLGRTSEAVEALQDAEELFESLAAADPKYASQYVGAITLLSTLGVFTGGAQSLAHAERAVVLVGELLATDPAQRAQHVDALVTLGTTLDAVGRTAAAYARFDEAVTSSRQLVVEDPVEGPPALSYALSMTGRCLSRLGRPDEGLVPTGEAVDVLADVPDTVPFVRVVRAISLGMLAACLATCRRPAEALPLAERAVGLFDALVREGETLPGMEIARAEALSTLGQSHLALGRPAEALAPAVAARNLLRTSTMDNAAIRTLLASAHLVVGGCLAGVQQPGDALEALAEAENLLGAAPDEDLVTLLLRAGCLISTGGCHLALGRPDLAAECADRALEVLDGVPDQLVPPGEPVRALCVHAMGLTQLGEFEAGYRSSVEALEIYHDLPPAAAAEQAMFAGVLSSAGLCLTGLRRPDEAMDFLEQAIAAYREVQPDLALAGVLSTYGTCAFTLGDPATAAEATAESIELFGASGVLQAGSPVVAEYGNTLKCHAQCLMQLGQPAGGAIDEAVAVLHDLPDEPAYRLALAQALGVQAVERATTGAVGVLELATESVRLFREFDGMPDVLPALASILGLIGQCLLGVDRLQDAMHPLSESADRFAALPEPHLQLVLERFGVERNLTFCLGGLGDDHNALGHARVALELLRLVAHDDRNLLPALSETMAIVAECLANTEQVAAALDQTEEAATVQLALAQESPADNAPLLVQVLQLQAELLQQLGRTGEAAQISAHAQHWQQF